MPILRHEKTPASNHTPHHRNHGALRMDSQMPRMSERHLDQNTGRQHQNRDPRMEQIRQRRMAQTPGGNEMRKTARTVLAVTTMCMALAGCGNATADTPDVMPATSAQCTETHTDVIGKVGRMVSSQECEITLKDTRKTRLRASRRWPVLRLGSCQRSGQGAGEMS